jgi:hypothetical protein
MRKFIFLLVSFFSLTAFVHAQSAKAVYFEIGGPGVASLNFDTRLGKNEAGIGVRGALEVFQ